MAAKKRFLIDSRVLVLFLILGIPPLVVGHLILVGGTAAHFGDSMGQYFSTRADGLQLQLIGYIETISIEVANLASIPAVQDVAMVSNRRQPDESRFAEQIQETEREWIGLSPGNSRLLDGILDNPASRFLREHNSVVATYREILVTDRFGRLVAASSKISDYFQADENWWRVAYLEGKGQRFISDVVYDESARVHCIEMAEPILAPGSEEVIGIIKTVVDADALFGMLDSSRFRESVMPVLIREDGSIVTDPGSVDKYPFVAAIRSEMNLNRSHLAAPPDAPRVFLGLPSFTIKDRIPELDWTLVLQAPYGQVYAPFQQMKSRFLYIVLFSVGLVIILSVLFSWLLSKPIVETDPHLERV